MYKDDYKSGYTFVDVLGVYCSDTKKEPYDDFGYEYMAKKEKLGKIPPKIRVSREMWFESFMPKTYN